MNTVTRVVSSFLLGKVALCTVHRQSRQSHASSIT